MQIRSRMCAREFKSDARPDLYAGTPPLEALKAIKTIAANHREMFFNHAHRRVTCVLPCQGPETSADMIGQADMTFIVNKLCQKMSSPNQQSLTKLKRLARYLKRERKWGQVFEYGKLAEELTAFTDSDWAGCKETRKSASAGVLMLGGHTLKAYTRKQKVIAESSAEAELLCSSIGSVGSKGGPKHDARLGLYRQACVEH